MSKDPDIVTEEPPLIILYSKSAVCMDNYNKYTKHTRHIYRRVNFVINGDKYKMRNIYWYERGLKLSDIVTHNVGGDYLKT